MKATHEVINKKREDSQIKKCKRNLDEESQKK